MQTMRCRCSNRLQGIILQEVCTSPVRGINKRAKSTLQTSKRAQSTLQHRKVQPLAESNDVTEFPYRRLQDNDDIGHIGMKRFQRATIVEPQEFKLVTKSQIPELFLRYMGKDRLRQFPTHVQHPEGNDHPPPQYREGNCLDPMQYMAAGTVLPMRANTYVINELIDWSKVPDDPIFQLVFPQPAMLQPGDLANVTTLLRNNASRMQLRDTTEAIRQTLNPHPALQKEMNVPRDLQGNPINGMQHKYRETVLFFPTEGQYCHSYCTYCFRWAQFTSVGSSQTFQSTNYTQLCDYLAHHKNISDVLFTGGDPMVMTSHQWRRYIDPLINDPRLHHISNIRIGTKSLAYWPYRYLTEKDSVDILRLFENIVSSGRHLTVQAHMSHPRELSTGAAEEAIRLIRMTGAQIRSQAPLINHVNANADTWADMWRKQVRLGIVPYYMFVERDTGARHYFEVPLVDALKIYTNATSQVSGIGRTVRGPSMSATPGKVHVVGEVDLSLLEDTFTKGENQKALALKFLQGRNPDWTGKLFFAKYDPKATWIDHLKPVVGDRFWFEDELDIMVNADQPSGTMFPLDIPEDNHTNCC